MKQRKQKRKKEQMKISEQIDALTDDDQQKQKQ